MAQCTVKTTRVYTLVLTQDEAEYLKKICQNDLTNRESHKDSECRKSIFTSIHVYEGK